MSQIEWYYARDNKQLGPVSSVELKRLATAGSLGPDDLVWREGMAEWAAARNVRGLFDEEGRAGQGGAPVAPAQSPIVAETPATPSVEPAVSHPAMPAVAPAPARHFFDVMFDRFRPAFGERFIETTAHVFRLCGSYGLFAAAALAAAFAVISATKGDAVVHLLNGFLWVVILLALQYVAVKFCDGVERLNRETTGTLAFAALPDCFAVLFKVAGAAILIKFIAVAVESGNYSLVLEGAPVFFVFIYLTAIAMNPKLLNVSIAPDPLPGGEAIGVVLFLAKSLLRLVPVAFGVGVLCGTLLMALACYYQAYAGELVLDGAARLLLFQSAALPLAAYLSFLLVNLVVHIWRSILSLPGKLDALAERNPAEEKKPE